MRLATRYGLTWRALLRCKEKRWYSSEGAGGTLAPAPAAISSHDGSNRATTNNSGNDDRPAVELYQFKICPFCNQTKALLAYSGTEYTVIEVNPLTRREIKWSQDYKKVPIATIDHKPYFGSEKIAMGLLDHPAIQNRLETRWSRNGTTTNWDDFSNYTNKWVMFANDELASLLYPNMCRTWSDSYAAFRYVHEVKEFSPLQRVGIQTLGSVAMYLAASKVKRNRNITDEWLALLNVLTILETEGLGGGNEFLSKGPEPDLGDLAVYGTLRCLEGLPIHSEIVHNRGGLLRDWYTRMKKSVESSHIEK